MTDSDPTTRHDAEPDGPDLAAYPPWCAAIVNHGGYDDVEKNLTSLARQSHPPVAVAVYDTGVDTVRFEEMRRMHPQVDFELGENRGYAGGANRVLERVIAACREAEFCLLLNPDVELDPDFGERLIHAMVERPHVAIGGGRLLRPGRSKIDSAGIRFPRNGRPRDRASEEDDIGQFAQAEFVDGASGAAMMLRVDALPGLRIGRELFDESFFAYHEDTDLCWRARRLGWHVLYEPSAVAVHARGWRKDRRQQVPVPIRRHSFKNHYLQLAKNLTLGRAISNLPWLLTWEILRFGFVVLRDPPMWPAYGQALEALPGAFRARRVISQRANDPTFGPPSESRPGRDDEMTTPASIGSPIVPTIVLPTFRGAVHLPRQIESLQAQSHGEWRLLVRDDDSCDETAAVLERFARTDPRIEIITDGDGRLGVLGNFSRLLECALAEGANWVALCDQDDVWLPNKLELQLDRIAAASPSPYVPMLLHSDLAVVNASLEPIAPSLQRSMGIRHEPSNPLPALLIQNFVTGCTCIANRALLELATPIPADAVMPDWWLALCAASSGHIDFVPETTLLYRQHDANAVGARSLRSALGATLRRALTLRRHDPQEFLDTLAQAAALERRLAARLEEAPGRDRIEASVAFIADYLSLFRERTTRIRRVVGMHRRRIRRQNGLLDAMLKLRLLTRTIDYQEPDSDRHEGSSIGGTRGTRHE